MKALIVRYNAGNVFSVRCALERLGVDSVTSDDPEEVRAAEKVIFPGVGSAAPAMRYLSSRGLDAALLERTGPTLGICLGLQLLCRGSEEGPVDCLGLFPGEVRRFPRGVKAPHMGWNRLETVRGPLFRGLEDGAYVYFVHSYFADVREETAAECVHGGVRFSAALAKDNFFAVQFHPEKSGEAGRRILSNFMEL